MSALPFPAAERLNILFAHAAYQLGDAFAARNTGISYHEVRDFAALEAAAPEADIIVCSGLWRNSLLGGAKKLRFVQSVSAGTDQFDKALFAEHGIRLASGQGINERAVAEHAIALVLALTRKLHSARDNQNKRFWRGMIADPKTREDELGGKTMVIVGLGRIGSRLARIAKAFDMKVIGVKRDPASGAEAADEAYHFGALPEVVAKADIVVLTCPLTPETTGLMSAAVLACLQPHALLINVARGKVVDEAALVDALAAKRFAGAGLDVTIEEPLASASPLWEMPQVLITPHTAGETSRYESNAIDILLENLGRLGRGETRLKNEIV